MIKNFFADDYCAGYDGNVIFNNLPVATDVFMTQKKADAFNRFYNDISSSGVKAKMKDFIIKNIDTIVAQLAGKYLTQADAQSQFASINTALGGKLGTTAKAANASKVIGGTITLTGSVTGSGSFNSAGNVNITTSGGGTNLLPNKFYQGATNINTGVMYEWDSAFGLLIRTTKCLKIQGQNVGDEDGLVTKVTGWAKFARIPSTVDTQKNKPAGNLSEHFRNTF